VKVDYFGDDLGLCMYTFRNCTYKDVINYILNIKSLIENYKITGVIVSRKYWLFGALTVKVILETEEAIKRYGGSGEEAVYKMWMS